MLAEHARSTRSEYSKVMCKRVMGPFVLGCSLLASGAVVCVDAAPVARQTVARGAPAAAADPCDDSQIELSSPHGRLLAGAGVTLRWRSNDRGPFRVKVTDSKGKSFFDASTFGHEMRVLVSRGAGAMGGPHPPELEPGGSYRWTVQPEFASDPTKCPVAEFRILTPAESKEATDRFQGLARQLGKGAEEKEPEPEIALARRYIEEEFYAEAEKELRRLMERGWEDERITGALADIYRKTRRQLSLQELTAGGPGQRTS